MEHRMERTAMLLGDTCINVLQNAHVMIFGLGGVGSYAAEALARTGIGKLTLVDGDHFAPSNINRQLNALVSTVGKSKVSVTAQRIYEINPDAVVNPIEAFYLTASPVPIPDDVDYVVDAIDTVSAKLHIIEICNNRSIPIISCMGMGNRLNPTLIRMGDVFETNNCGLCRIMRKELRKRAIEKLRCVYSTEEACSCTAEQQSENGRRSIPGSVAYVPSVAGLYMAYEVVQALCSGAKQ